MKQNITIVADQMRIGIYDLSASKLKDFEQKGIRFPATNLSEWCSECALSEIIGFLPEFSIFLNGKKIHEINVPDSIPNKIHSNDAIYVFDPTEDAQYELEIENFDFSELEVTWERQCIGNEIQMPLATVTYKGMEFNYVTGGGGVYHVVYLNAGGETFPVNIEEDEEGEGCWFSINDGNDGKDKEEENSKLYSIYLKGNYVECAAKKLSSDQLIDLKNGELAFDGVDAEDWLYKCNDFYSGGFDGQVSIYFDDDKVRDIEEREQNYKDISSMAHIFCLREISDSIFTKNVECQPEKSKLRVIPPFVKLNDDIKIPMLEVSYADQGFEFRWGNKQPPEFYFVDGGGKVIDLQALYDENDDNLIFKIIGINNGERQIKRNEFVTASSMAARISLDDEDEDDQS